MPSPLKAWSRMEFLVLLNSPFIFTFLWVIICLFSTYQILSSNHKGALVTIVDRKSKFTLIKKVPSKHAEVVTKAIVEMMQPIK